MKKKLAFFILLILNYLIILSQGIIIDHTCTDISQIPANVIDDIQANIKWHYAHTSHGEQLTYGLQFLEDDDSSLAYEVGYSYLPNVTGSLCIFDGQETETYITPDLYWETAAGLDLTQDVLDHNPTINVSQWAFCTQLNYYDSSQVQDYLDAMARLEADNPGVTFVYMTGNAQSDGADGYNRYQRNEQIRQYCVDNNKVLFDFADLDCWHNGEFNSYEYNGTTVPLEHPDFNGDYYAHTTESSCRQKGRAVWWMLARLRGWEPSPPSGYSVTPTSIDFGQVQIEESDSEIFTITNVDTIPVTIDSIVSNNSVFTLTDLGRSLAGFTLEVDESKDIEVTFSPTAVQTYSGVITVYSSQAGNSEVNVSGEGTDSPSGGYHVCGDVDGVWNYDLIYVDCDLQVPHDYTLTINPPAGGTDIIFTGHYKFCVYGRLVINGTEEDSVRFLFLYESSRITVENCLFEDNSADDGGGGLHVRYCSPFIKNCVFRQNSAVNGAGIHFSGSSSSLEYCLFENNSATYGGAMYFDACSPNILNCTISENSASSNGGAIVLYDYSYPEFVNCILWNDSPNEIHSLVEGGEPTFSYSDIQGSWSGTGYSGKLERNR
ncbi:MAG: hypothetical protein B6D62_03005 [Candidatus Cloacimonas sp. 4484_275]|nr:MAG: hypothetical protein B6D62_03005 [Candidatus Cloacimonas sp. 4484_275]